jgi:KilA-N domain
MKTNQILTRKMGDFKVNQHTSDGMFNATELLKQWNEKSGQQKQMIHFTENVSTKEFIETIENDIISKERNSVLMQSRGKNGGSWMHPYLFIDFAMWINPKFKLQVIKFVYDELIKNRHDAGDNYRLLAESVSKIVTKPFLPMAIQNIAKAINYVVFNKHESGIRNTQASEESLKQLSNLELKLSELINDGFIKDYDQTMSFLRRQWNNNHQPKLLKQSA